ncbi:hypothetical protein [Photobacterium kishitanii]|uniref:Uncharacterized protein n=1 Tax=Photobacterium kishitanii TaxID=318456 RepID=A0A2T3KM77_9GAMM|nr:hypothetical protein [Photobacterium kishitanii]PSV00891.1 hypothetical protein C9J27_02370 [Photobacterium kishitanii]
MNIVDNGEELVEITTTFGSVTSSDIFSDPDYYLMDLILKINAELGADMLTVSYREGLSVQIADEEPVVFYSSTPCDVFYVSEMMSKLFSRLRTHLTRNHFS